LSLSIIHGSREGLSFAATHPRKLLDWRNISDLWRRYPLFSSSCSARGSNERVMRIFILLPKVICISSWNRKL
jgi:hypothetical protein